MKDRGVANIILDLGILRNNSSLILSQSHYIEKVLKKFNYLDCASIFTSFDPNLKLVLNSSKPVAQLNIQELLDVS